MIKILLLLACIIALPVATAAQGLVLVQHPPVYEEGEFAQGVFFGETGTQLVLLQQAQYGPDGEVYIILTALDEDGNVRLLAIFDPRTWQANSVSVTETVRVIDTTCSPDTLYPITLGKVYQCSSTIQVNDRVLNDRSRMDFNEVESNENDHVVGFCATTVEDDGEMKATARVCSSSDGKWIRTIHVLDVAQSE